MRLYSHDAWTVREARHLIARAGFGATNEQVLKLYKMGRVKAVDTLLNDTVVQPLSDAPEWTTLENEERQQKYRRTAEQSVSQSDKELNAQQKERAVRNQIRRMMRKDGAELKNWWLREMYQGKSPLREKLTVFWHDHFPVSAIKVRNVELIHRQNRLFHDHAVGNFRTLTKAIVNDPAMMVYLDANKSVKAAPNENLARELMELFTLGEGHYTERDIKEAARAMTGHVVDRRKARKRFSTKKWDSGVKTVFGQKGKFKADDIVDLIFEGERPSRFIAEKLCLFFASDQPDQEVIAHMARSIVHHDYEIRPALRILFLSEYFYCNEVLGTQIKSPLDFLMQLAHQLELPPELLIECSPWMNELGMKLYEPPNVAGWNWGQAWITTSTLLARYNYSGALIDTSTGAKKKGKRAFARKLLRPKMAKAIKRWGGPRFEKLVPNSIRGSAEEVVKHLSDTLFLRKPNQEDYAQFVAFAQEKESSQISDDDLKEIFYLMMSNPYYQLT